MQTSTKATSNTAITLRAKLGVSVYGHHQPEIEIVGITERAARMEFRKNHARVYRLAAAVEEASAATGNQWCVIPDKDRNRVHLELVDASDEEAARAMAILEVVVRSEAVS